MADIPSWDWLGDDLAIDLANTVRRRGDREAELIADPDDLRAWLAHEADRLPPVGRVDAAGVRRFVDLRNHALAVLRAAACGEALPAGDVAAVNAVVLATPTVALLGERAGAPARGVLHAGDALGAVLAVLAAAVVDLVARPAAGGLALCDAPSCGQLFLRGRADQRWCGPGCGNRVRAARHHARAVKAADR
jgi:predicted RNA-binding Zn ribbon-like protein